jgi:hypothetical protein
VAGAALAAVVAVGAGYVSSLWSGQETVLISFAVLLAVGCPLALRRR